MDRHTIAGRRLGLPGFAASFLAPPLLAAFAFAALPPAAQASPIELNESYVDRVIARHGIDIDDVNAVFSFVFSHLPEKVKVYPTEHYYYFKFVHEGIPYGGNFRLENELRDRGQIHFAYTPEYSEWVPGAETRHRLLDAKDGVAVERIDDFTYRVTHAGKSVVFALNRMEGVTPPKGAIAPGERYIGPVFDESAVRFFLVYDPERKHFLYILDETGPQADALVTSHLTDRILLGTRTGFAFYRDHKLDRRILIGVFANNSRLNNYFDGPFDQLPDNFLDGNELRDAILEVEPALEGQIDRYGSSFDGETRYMIAPYLHYEAEEELAIFHRCATNEKIRAELYHACFVVEDEEASPPRLAGERELKQKPQRPARQPRRK